MVAILMIGLLAAVAFVSVAGSLNAYSGKRSLGRNGQDESWPEENDWEVT